MKKIGIITLFGNYNYGNRLQNLAVQEYLNQEGFKATSIYRTTEYDKNLLNYSKLSLKRVLSPFNKKYKRYLKFWKFTKENFEFITVHDDNDYKKIDTSFDYFFVGSDQVWNPEFFEKPFEQFLLFTTDEKKVAFSASFGVESLNETEVKKMYAPIRSFKYISVREQMGCDLIEKYFKKDSICLIDPTMMVQSSFWFDKLINISIDRKYILLYYLGNLSDEYISFIASIKSKYNFEVINLMDVNCKFYTSDPYEFISLINNAELVLTDSFHGTVFSIIFDTPFIIFERKDQYNSMNSRLDTLLSKFHLNTRRFHNITESDIFNHDYDYYNEQIINERLNVKNFLNSIFTEKN